MKKSLIITVALFIAIMVQAQNIAKGYVYEDINKNGKKERSEKGLAQVAVSNGREVVLTDEKGYYELPVGKDNIIFVIKPSGYDLPINEYNQPQFYYIHKPAGSPDNYKYNGVAPTGKLPSSINFGLLPGEDTNKFTALIYGDPQPYTDDEVDYFARAIVAETKKLKNISFGLSLGDLVGDTLNLHKSYIKVVKENELPWFNVMGNHDMNYEAVADSLSDETFESNFGPANYAFNYGQAHFIVLDDILYPDPRGNKGYWGGFRPDQLDFLKNDLKYIDKNHLVVLSFHIPLFNEGGDTFRDSDRQELFRILHDYPNVLLLSAHTHYQLHYFHGKENGCQREKPIHEFNVGTTSGDWYSGILNEQGIPVSTMRDGTPKGYVLLNIDENQYKLDYKAAGQPEDYQIAIYSPKVLARNKRTSSAIYANFFMGSVNDKVEYRINKGDWQPMRHVENVDPHFMRQVQDYDYSDTILPGKRPSNPVKCTHLWSAPIQTNLPLGNHTIEVRATDMFGRTYTQTASYLLN